MERFEDYYEVLQVHPSAEPEVIDAAYKKLAQKYHPDVSNNPAAAERMKKINVAHDILGDPEQRRKYHSDWLQRKHTSSGSPEANPNTLPMPILEPTYIKLNNVSPGQLKKVSFIVINGGGPYSKISIDNPDSWLRVTNWQSLSSSDELPLKVYIEAQGRDWSTAYSENVRVRLDKIEARIKVDLQTKQLIRDHKWHDIDYDELKNWVKKRKDRLDMGDELTGKTFAYKLNRGTGRYQIRLRHAYTSAIYDPFH